MKIFNFNTTEIMHCDIHFFKLIIKSPIYLGTLQEDLSNERRRYLLFSQFAPVHPGLHLQVKRYSPSSQSPWLPHGFDKHWFSVSGVRAVGKELFQV